jgi:hypothetical protein
MKSTVSGAHCVHVINPGSRARGSDSQTEGRCPGRLLMGRKFQK